MIDEGLIITVIGMSVVFVFLGVMVIAIKLASWFVLKFSKATEEMPRNEYVAKKTVAKPQNADINVELELIAASLAAAKFLSEREME